MEQDRLEYLDGIRSLMAINVVLCHFVEVYYPQMYIRPMRNRWAGC